MTTVLVHHSRPFMLVICALFFVAAGGSREPESSIANFTQCSERIYSGAEPTTVAHFRELADFGVTTIVSVDGSTPPLSLASQAKLRYVHIPIGYDGVPPQAIASLARVIGEVEGRIFIHCHHGKHRGPTAAAIACRLDGTATALDAVAMLQAAGTNPDYAGLWRAASQDCLRVVGESPELKPSVQVKPLVHHMAETGRFADRMKLSRDVGWNSGESREHALLLLESLRESRRVSQGRYDAKFQSFMRLAEHSAQGLYSSLRLGDKNEAERHLAQLNKSCIACHAAYRN